MAEYKPVRNMVAHGATASKGSLVLSGREQDGNWYCPECGTPNSFNFCSNCGAKRPGTQQRSFRVGDLVSFGSYPYTRSGRYTEIEWIVLETDGGYALLISRYGIDTCQYNREKTDVTWESSYIRRWLNSSFKYEAFSEQEREAILWTEVDNSDNQGDRKHNTDGGADTVDQVFLLSYQEVNRLFGNWLDRSVYCTAYAETRGANIRSREKADDLFDGKGAGKSYWWLRTPANEQYRAYYINAGGDYDWGDVNNRSGTIRPALCVACHALNDISGDPYEGQNRRPSDGTSKKNKIEYVSCHKCHGTGICQRCYGSGTVLSNANPDKTRSCYSCSGTGKCFFCAGLGTEEKVN